MRTACPKPSPRRPAWWASPPLAAALLSLAAGCGRSSPEAAPGVPAGEVRPAAVAGRFYPADPAALAQAVDACLESAQPGANRAPLAALIVPHAAYEFSGNVAGAAYAALKEREVGTVVIVGPSHYVPVEGAALLLDDWHTPLGSVPAARDLIGALAQREGFAVTREAHAREHSIEVQLPFLQRAAGRFRLAAVAMSDFSAANCTRVAAALADALRGRGALLIASSDMSHFPPYDQARAADRRMLKAITSFDPQEVRAADAELMGEGMPSLECTLCGLGPVLTVMEAARLLGGERVEVLAYANSGDAPSGGRSRVVGYGAVAIYGKEGVMMKSAQSQGPLNEEQQRKLLRLARRTIEEYVRNHHVIEVADDDPVLQQPRGVFVTLERGAMLRGCIGDLEGRMSLYLNVRDKAIASAAHDLRFDPVRANELDDLTIEISVLSPMEKVQDPLALVAGKHGVMVCQGRRAGVYLPQVATEQGWTMEETLNHVCLHKAGLPEDAWRRGAEVYCFTAQVFGEKELGR